jgi:hypothetical protein
MAGKLILILADLSPIGKLFRFGPFHPEPSDLVAPKFKPEDLLRVV